jgi:hypothetical protein
MPLPLRSIDLRRQDAGATGFCTVAPNMCGWSVLNVYRVTILAHISLRLLLDFSKSCAHLCYRVHNSALSVPKLNQINPVQAFSLFL